MTALDAPRSPRPYPETEHLPNTERQAGAESGPGSECHRGWESGCRTELDVVMIGFGESNCYFET